MVLRMLHLVGIVAWLGSAAADVVVEIVAKRSSPELQRAYLRLHTLVDAFLEGPGLILTLITGALLLSDRGFLLPDSQWPTWMRWKIGAALGVTVSNTLALITVQMRYRASIKVPAHAPLDQDADYAFWGRINMITWIGVPLSAVALVLGGLFAV